MTAMQAHRRPLRVDFSGRISHDGTATASLAREYEACSHIVLGTEASCTAQEGDDR